MEKYKIFLKDIELINSKYEEYLKISHYNFNVFSILRSESDEVKLHSAFIGELLDPAGSHGMGNIFLDIFIDIIQKETKLDLAFNSEEIFLELEKSIGEIPEDGSNGGRMDIYIYDGITNMAIENKIYAGDQPNQLIRYKNYLSKNSKPHFLFYLTLDGEDPSEDSSGKLVKGKDFFNISYSDHILNWLELCKKESVGIPIIRETIEQYIQLIKKLTGKSLNEEYIMKLSNFLSKDETNLKLAKNIAEVFPQIRIEVQKKFWESLNKSINEEGCKIIQDYSADKVERFYNQRESTYPGINIEIPNIKADELYFRIEIDGSLFFGFTNGCKVEDDKYAEILKNINSYVFNKDAENWFGWVYPKHYCNNNELNFKSFNSANIFELADEVKRGKITDKIAYETKELITEFEKKVIEKKQLNL